ncbi:MAG: prepilin-type N-terminal cleavage/methylation domain-containing protein [Oscillospiraceae bacterium]|nr:prepilin-type N-terminal cleavage/methylation domain-containing protein [Oscillospiraceae bacterium]
MKNLKAKLRRDGGFTLVEMLIVVAIIAILVAISIPAVSAALEKTKHAVDQSNLRNAVAVANIKWLSSGAVETGPWYYHVDKSADESKVNATGYLDNTKDGAVEGQCKDCKEKIVQVTYTEATADKEAFFTAEFVAKLGG